MQVETSVEDAFRSLLEEMHYKKITVSLICSRANIARKTFYAYFENKENVISRIFVRDVINPQRVLVALLPMEMKSRATKMFHEKLYGAILADRDFWYRLVGPLKGVDDTFLRVATRAIYDLDFEIINENSMASHAVDWQVDYVAYFFASSQAMLMQKWISEGMVVPISDLADLYDKLIIDYWKTS